ncbi:MAG: sigma-70 family RNA polymerase sigma factor [Chitinophagaceae bacterium]|nr:sigma-70 family RNA polymerase sigma factor [Chitinophagaceae bacterium]
MELNDYNTCVREWSDAVFRFACKCTGNQEDARDIVQNSFSILWQKREDVEPAKAKSFLFQVAYRQSVDLYRKQNRISYKEEVQDTRVVTTTNTDLKKVLDRALSKLDDQARALVLLKDYEGYTYNEIAQITGLSDSQVKVYLHRARKTLKDYLVSVEHII